MSKVQVDTIDTRSGTATMTVGSTNTTTVSIPKAVTLGASGTTVTVPSGATITNSGTATGFPDNGPAFSAYIGTMTNVADSTSTIITATSEVFDSDGKYDTSNYRFTPGVTGKYFFYVSFKNNQSSARLQCGIYKNGSIISESQGRMEPENHGHGSNTYTGVVGSQICICDNTSDYFQAFVWHKAGSNQTIYNSQFMGFRLAGL